ncbi:hypothetical protein D3C72_1203350 [compost metagenome]
MHGEDHWFGAARLRDAPRVDTLVRVLEAARSQLRRQLHQIEACREMVAVGEHDGAAHFIVALEFPHGQGQVIEHGAVESVAFAGPFKTDKEQMTTLLSGNATRTAVCFAHGRLLLA